MNIRRVPTVAAPTQADRVTRHICGLPTDPGHKNPKHIRAFFVTDACAGCYWEDQGCHRFGGS